MARLTLLLSTLAESAPQWGQFLDGDEIVGSKVLISGASQRGKTATYISRAKQVDRAVLLNAFGSAFQGSDGGVEIAP
jgi:hypothetical protein